MAEFPGIPKDYLTVSFLQQLKEYIDEKAAGGGGGGGGGGTAMIVGWAMGSLEDQYLSLDKTWKEIHDALQAGTTVVLNMTEIEGVSTEIGVVVLLGATHDDANEYYYVYSSSNSFDASGENDYPRYYFY